jgi:protocatechuate 3,4-dioxygenase beta subunit
MNRRMIFSIAVIACSVALAGCATGTPVAVAPLTTSSTDQPIPLTSNTSVPAASTSVSSAAAAAPAGSDALACASGSQSASLTPELTEGPFFKANSPERASLLDGSTTGTKLVLTGAVYTADCKPVPHALLDFWQADASGAYDNSGYNFRGHQYTDANGHYQLTTVVPGLYTGRTEHIHVKVQAPNGQLITTQLFFPGVAQNDSDGIYNPALLVALQQGSDGDQAQYNFVVPAQ